MSGLRTVLVAVGATVLTALTAGCAAGQHAATADEKSTVDAGSGQVGKIQLVNVALQAPSGPSYAKGAAVPLTAYIVNNGQTADSLVKVSSSAFTGGWNVVSTPSLLPGPSGAPTAAAPTSPVSGSPQRIGPGSALALGLQNLSGSGAGSPETLVLYGSSATLFPGTSVQVTFTFAKAGQATITVPVQISNTPNSASLPGGSAGAAG